jgi:hypothetical protein
MFFVLLLLVSSRGVMGQTIEQRGYVPVDQTVDDVDPLARSLRLFDAGLDVTGQHNNVFRSPSDPEGRLIYVQRGTIAEFDRSVYAYTRKGEVLQFTPPGIVYHLSVPDPNELKKASKADDLPDSAMLVKGRVNGMVDGAAQNANTSGESMPSWNAGTPPASPPDADAAAWHQYQRTRHEQRAWLLETIRREARGDSIDTSSVDPTSAINALPE